MLIAKVVHEALRHGAEVFHKAASDALKRVAVAGGRKRAQLGLEIAVDPLVGVHLRRVRLMVMPGVGRLVACLMSGVCPAGT